MALWWNACSGCEKPWTVVGGKECCTTPGCKYRANLPESKTGLSSPSKPIPDPAEAREFRDLERMTGWTPALPFTECICWSFLLDSDQPADQPHFPDCPLYEDLEPEPEYEAICMCGGSGGSDGKIDPTKHAPQCPAYVPVQVCAHGQPLWHKCPECDAIVAVALGPPVADDEVY